MMTVTNEYLSTLKNVGLAARAQKLTFGCKLTGDAVKEGTAELVLVCESAAPNTADKIKYHCERNMTECITVPIDPSELARAVGKSKPLAVVGIIDRNLAIPVRNSLLGLSKTDNSSQTVSESEV